MALDRLRALAKDTMRRLDDLVRDPSVAFDSLDVEHLILDALMQAVVPVSVEGDPPVRPAICLDCGRDYADFGMDVLLPRWQWLLIHPDEGGLLCAQCIVNRASKIPGAVALEAVIGIAPKEPPCSL